MFTSRSRLFLFSIIFWGYLSLPGLTKELQPANPAYTYSSIESFKEKIVHDFRDYINTFDPLWSHQELNAFQQSTSGGFNFNKKLGLVKQISFPGILDRSHPIILHTQMGRVEQTLDIEEQFEGQLLGRYLLYKGNRRSIFFRYDSEQQSLREYVFISHPSSLIQARQVVRWKYSGATIQTLGLGRMVLMQKKDTLSSKESIKGKNMRARVSRFLQDELESFTEEENQLRPILIIPPPEYIDAKGLTQTTGLEYVLDDQTLKLAFNTDDKVDYPIWVDPSLTAANDAELTVFGDVNEALLGFSVANAGDVNGDEINDVVVGAYNENTNGESAGRAYIFLGRSLVQKTEFFLRLGADVIINGEPGSFFGYSVAGAGDFNGDGLKDIIVGAPYADRNGETDSGAAYIIFGSSDFNVNSQPVLNAVDSPVILEGQDAGDHFGFSVSTALDFRNDGNGKDDVIVGSPEDDNNNEDGSGSAHIFAGRTVTDPITLRADSSASHRFDGQGTDGTNFERFNDSFGWSVASAGDFNNDDIDDVIIGAPGDDNTGLMDSDVFDDSGSAFIFFGGIADGVYRADDDAEVILNGQSVQDNFGFSVAGAGDFNGDDFDDVIVGAPFDDNNGENMSGSAFIFFGNEPGSQQVQKADINASIILNGQDEEDRFGWSVATAGDFNGDTRSDVIVGAPKDGNGGEIGSGSAFIFFGQNPGMQTILRADEDAGVILNGQNGNNTASEQGDEFGVSVASGGVFGNTGVESVVVGAWLYDEEGEGAVNSGAAYLFYGLSASFDEEVSSGLESESNVSINVSLNIPNPLPADVTVNYALSNGDVTIANDSIVFSQGEQTKPITFFVNDDSDDEDDEGLFLTLISVVNAGLGDIVSHSYTIIDNDGDDTKEEGNDNAASPKVYFETTKSSGSESTSDVSLNVVLSNSALNTVGVGFSISGGTATEDTDFTLEGTSLTFDPGETTQSISLAIEDDSIMEKDETVEIVLANPFNTSIGINSTHTYTIEDDETTLPTVAFNSNILESSESGSDPSFNVVLSQESGKVVTVDFSVSGQTQGGDSFSLTGGTITFNQGITTREIEASIINDNNFDPTEIVEMTLHHPVNATLGDPSSHTFTILDDDLPPFRGVVSPYWQTDEGSYTFIAITHPSLTGMSSRIGLHMEAKLNSGGGQGIDFTISPNDTQRLFIVGTNNPVINPEIIPTAEFIIIGTQNFRHGQLNIQSVRFNELEGSEILKAFDLADIRMLSFWGAIVAQSTSTGFSMEFLGDVQDSRAFQTPNVSGVN